MRFGTEYRYNQGLDRVTGDLGQETKAMMFGYACSETPEVDADANLLGSQLTKDGRSEINGTGSIFETPMERHR